MKEKSILKLFEILLRREITAGQLQSKDKQSVS